MVSSLQEKLLWREQGSSRPSNIRSIYGDPYWVHNLDIVNELGGHRGCVNALSWSKSGRLLASGSDDTNLLIHRYQADDSTKPFTLATEIATGHTANIFSVKFMPHSNDNTLISCAGDSEVRVFDVEYSARNRPTSTGALGFRGGETYNGVRYLGEGDTNARVYRSHADRVKRIVTESSPFLFLTCSEDGEVRQWDLRQPSSAYPEPRSGRTLFSNRRSSSDGGGNVPPPLISYRRYRLDLNTITCSASQPHYIALGGAHLHCFLHDRRMIGRDMALERGSDSSYSIDTDFQGDAMGKATRCVRRFAPDGRKKMGRGSNGHITACKISDARPNEMIVSWSGDHIYSFNLLRSPDAEEEARPAGTMQSTEKSKAESSQDLKRKRFPAASPGESTSKRRSRSSSSDHEDVALRVRYGNGQSEDIALETTVPGDAVEEARQAVLTPSHKRSSRIAKSVVKLRRLLFSLEGASTEESSSASQQHRTEVFREVWSLADKTLDDMDRVIKSWRYPVGPEPEEIAFHTTLRRQRDRARRFVQAAGVIAQLLGDIGTEAAVGEDAGKFEGIYSPATEGPLNDNNEIFRYDFLKAILAWLQGGTDTLLAAFREGSRPTRQAYRYPIPKEAGLVAIDRFLIRHLLLLATEEPVPDLERSRFEHDTTRQLFETERHAVTAFAHVVEVAAEVERGHIEAEGGSRSVHKDLATKARLYDPATTRRFWGLKVARGLLINAAEGVDFAFVDRAFGGLGRQHRMNAGRSQADIDPNEDDPEVESAEIVRRSAGAADGYDEAEDVQDSDEEAMVLLSHLRDEMLQLSSSEDSNDSDGGGDGGAFTEDSSDEEDGAEDGEEDEDEDQGIIWGHRRLIWASAAERAQLREAVDSDVPVNSHTRAYRGHCNVKTVKDVNFYGLDDEYVVSGSDSGHVFIWDRKTSKLLNILEGDGDIVNVVQGHPYEPMLAVSGIDHTVKIFSADHRAQRDARLGHNLAATQNQSESNFTTIGRRRFARPPRRRSPTAQENPLDDDDRDDENTADSAAAHPRRAALDEDSDDALLPPLPASRSGLASRRRMHDSYAIVSNNDIEREGGLHDAYITRGMLQQLAMHMRARRGGGAVVAADDGDEGEGGGGTVVVDDENCSVM